MRPDPAARALSAAAEKRRTPPETCATPGCDGKPAVTIRAVRLCRDCYAAMDLEENEE